MCYDAVAMFHFILLFYSLLISYFALPFNHEKEMQLIVNVKQLGKCKNAVEGIPVNLNQAPETLAQLITEIVICQVHAYNERLKENDVLRYLTVDNIKEKSQEGKIGFGINYNRMRADTRESVLNALQSFNDGIFRVFVGEEELTSLGQPVYLNENDKLTFVRLTMLAGRMW